MWIRSQDKTILKECNDIRLETYREVENGKETIVYVIVWESWQCFYFFFNRTLGKYSTEEKALKVLDMIQRHIGGERRVIGTYWRDGNPYDIIDETFIMPQDNEVKD
jgi:hypothetical protein